MSINQHAATARFAPQLLNGRETMTPDRTELEWMYQPADFFEAAYRSAKMEYDLVVKDGRVVATLTIPQDPVAEQLEGQIEASVTSIFLVRQLQVHLRYTLQGPRVYQYDGGRKNVAIRVGSVPSAESVGQLDIILRDPAGNIVRDTRAERIAANASLLDSIAPKLARSDVLNGLFTSYSRSVSDPSNELVHLYEIRDALSQHYGGEQNARAALNINRAEWQRLGFLANIEPLEQGRHRGKNIGGERAASSVELEEARNIVRNWIIAFARTL
jgi:hypothetical protein